MKHDLAVARDFLPLQQALRLGRYYDTKILERKGVSFDGELGRVQGIPERIETSSSPLLSPLLSYRKTCNLSSTSHLQEILLC